MRIAKVLGTVVSTQKAHSLQGTKFLLVQRVDHEGQLLPEYDVAAEWVLITQGSAARQMPEYERRPLDALVIAIIDTVSVSGGRIYSK